MSGTRMRRLSAAAAALALVTTGGIVSLPTAQAAEKLAPCTWEHKDRDNTFDCSKPTNKRPRVPIVDCWKYPPSDRTYVQRKSASGWQKVDVPFVARASDTCAEGYPWRSVLRLPTADLDPYEVARYRLVMPATSGTDDEGAAWEYGKTVIDFSICLVRPSAARTC